jgi:phage gpG-like protein
VPVHIRFTFFGEDQVNRTMVGFAERAADMRPAWDLIETRFTEYEEKWFSSEGDGQWPQLSKDYARWKAVHFPGEPVLHREGTLQDSMTKPDISIKEPGYAIFGSGDPVAGYHQGGKGNLPIRRVIDLDEDERSEWVKVVQRHLLGESDE